MVYIKEEDCGNIVILHFKGDFIIDYVEQVEKIWNKQIEKNPQIIGLNCDSLEHIDSSAIGVLIRFQSDCRSSGISLIFYGLTPPVEALFEIARLNTVFTIMDKESFEIKYLPHP